MSSLSDSAAAPSRLAAVLGAVFTAGLGLALSASGAAALVNQVVWQRSLGRLLGGSETLASMTVVLVFMAGLGIGSLWMGRRSTRMRDPLLALGLVEGVLALVNLAVASLLQLELDTTVFAAQKMAAAAGVPLLAFYALGATAVLMVPCLLMGATMPLAAEVCQRRLGWVDPRALGWLMFLNTIGSVGGALVSGGLMLPRFGQTVSLLAAVAGNATAGALLVLFALAARGTLGRAKQPELPAEQANEQQTIEPKTARPRPWWRPSLHEVLALGLGFCSLGYEMFLLRLFALMHEPLPFTFAAVITGFLLFWSVGAALSSRPRISLSAAMKLCAFSIVVSLVGMRIDPHGAIGDLPTLGWFIATRSFYFVPCLAFGYLFGLVTAQAARSWGHDVGRVYGWNTCGSCLGVVLMTLVGYEMPFFMMALALVPLLFALEELRQVAERGLWAGVRGGLALVACGAAVAAGLSVDMSFLSPEVKIYYGRDGVIGVHQQSRDMFWDGLWHSQLSDGACHIGTNNWFLATCPVIAHATGEIEDACVIGLGLGITAGTLAKLDSIRRVDAYEFNHTLKQIYAEYRDGTLGLADNPKINIYWEDARSGLSLREKQYDLIQTQPLYLKQAGSSLLNSKEFFQLVSRRLKRYGVFCLYSNGEPQQAFAVRQTAAEVFAGRETFMNGYLLVLSNEPIRIDEATLTRRLASGDPLWREIASCERTRDAAAILTVLDRPALPWGDGRLLVTDDRPIVEYPAFLRREVNRLGYQVALPAPGIHNMPPVRPAAGSISN
jgi:predicted membrane-bound spermidine synthase